MASHTLPPQQKKGNFLSGSTSRRASSSSISLSASPKLSPQGIGYSPSNTPVNTPAGSGISRTLRSLLPFSGTNKNATSSTATPPKGPFSGFGSIRKSTTRERERQMSLSNDAIPVVSISHPDQETPIRRSVSLSRLEKPLPMHPDALFSGEVHMQASERDLGYVLRSPSPVPPLSAELSTIIEADNSGMSKNIPVLLESVSTNPSSPSPAIQRDLLFVEPYSNRPRTDEQRNQGPMDPDSSALELPTDELAEEVREALRKSGSSGGSGKNWFSTDVVIDERRNPHFASSTLNMATVDADLLALLSPNSATGKAIPPTNPDAVEDVSVSPSRATRFRQASSFLPRLRSSNPNSPSPSPTTPRFSIHSSPTKASPSTPRATTLNQLIPPSPTPSSPRLASSVTSTPPRSSLSHPPVRSTDATSISVALSTPIARRPRSNIFTQLTRASSDVKTPSSTSRLGPRALRQAIHGITSSSERPHTPHRTLEDASGIPFGRGSLDSRRPHHVGSAARDIGLGRPSLDAPRVYTPALRARPRTRSSTSPERAADLESSPSPEVPFQSDPRHRPSFDSARPSLDTSSRPGSVARMRERERERERDQRTPSLRVIDASDNRISPREGDFRTRKRSMSVQERLHSAGGRTQLGGASEYGGGPSRPGSSLSGYGHGARRALGYDPDDPGSVSGGPGPKMEWLGPRTTRAFRDAGLLDFERSRDSPASRSGDTISGDSTERILSLRRDRSGSVNASSPLAGQAHTLSGHSARRTASEYNPSHGRSSSRTGFSEVGGTTSASSARMSSGSFSVYGSGNPPYIQGHQGLLDSPTFTISSSSRERDTTPKSSTSTAPTSISESLGYHTREREREREELREMRDKHATEMAALLAALSDSQRTVRMLREENGQLRDRFEHFSGVVRENENLRQTCAELENACMALRGEYRELHHELTSLKSRRVPLKLTPSWSEGSVRSGSRTPNGKFGQSSPLSVDQTPRYLTQGGREDEDEPLDSKEDVYDNTMIIHDDTIDDDVQDEGDTGIPNYEQGSRTRESHDATRGVAAAHNLASSLTPTHTRRLSNSSSIFPTVPANMTMLLHDDGAALTDMNRTNADQSQFHFSVPASPVPPIGRGIVSASPSTDAAKLLASQTKSHTPSLPPVAFRDFAGPSHRSNKSITSTHSISPTTANFSIMSSSPKSLFLRPEHELLLGDMESLDLGVRGTDIVESSQKARADDDAW